VAVGIDEARRHHQPFHVDAHLGGGVWEGTDRGDGVAPNRNVSGIPGVTGAVYDSPAAQNHVVNRRLGCR
jgi:hypothetical protein